MTTIIIKIQMQQQKKLKQTWKPKKKIRAGCMEK